MSDPEIYVRDLLWAINSPQLMRFENESPTDFPSVSRADIDGQHLRNWLLKRPEKRVGRYFERLIVYWVSQLRRCEVLAESQQMVLNGRTVGEIDLLFRDEQSRLTHWEIAVKFYLQLPRDDSGSFQYIGPNARDSLRKKRQRLLDHQLPLSAQFYPEVERRQGLVKGRIFYHWQRGEREIHSRELMNEHLSGRWLRFGELSDFLSQNKNRYQILSKPFWLADQIAHSDSFETLDASAIADVLNHQFTTEGKPVLISVFEQNANQEDLEVAHEKERCFIVPDQWPMA